MASKSEIYYKGVVDLCNLDIKAIHWYYEALLKTDNASFAFDKVMGFDIVKDYELGFTDNFVIEVQCTKKFYIETLYPLRNNFKIILKQTQQTEKEEGMKLIKPQTYQRVYKGVLVNPVDMGQSTSQSSTPDSNTDPNAEKTPVTVKIQLLHPAIEYIMRSNFGGNFHGVPGDIVKGMLSKSIEMLDCKPDEKPKGVEMVPPDNQKITTDVLIPHGIPILDLPRFVQKDRYGIYNYGLGSYLCKDTWYLYPLYQYDRYKKSDTRLTINVIPKAKIMDSPRTYHVYNRDVTILCGGGVEVSDDANARTTNEGDGATMFDPAKLRNESVIQNEKGTYLNPIDAKKQFVQNKRTDDLNYAPMVKDRLTTSLQHAMSNIAQRNGIVLTFIWEYANPHLLVPGMPVRVVYFKNEVKYEITGVLLKEAGAYQLVGGTNSKKHLGSVGLAVMVDQDQFNNTEKKQYQSTSSGVGKSLIKNLLSIF